MSEMSYMEKLLDGVDVESQPALMIFCEKTKSRIDRRNPLPPEA